MKTLAIILVVISVLYGFGRLNKYLSDNMYNDCMNSHEHSQETCYHYAYEQ